MCSRLKSSRELLAIKVMEKRFIIKEKKVGLVNMERKILSSLRHPNIVSLHYSFHDKLYLYIVTDLCAGGELRKLVDFYLQENKQAGKKKLACSVERCQRVIAEVICGLQYLHMAGIIHRDLKPENVLLDKTGRVKLVDFGTAKDEKVQQEGKEEFVGSRDYVSPEMLNEEPVSVGADLWALGCVLYYMIVGDTPFAAESEYLTFQNITSHGEGGKEPRIKVQNISSSHKVYAEAEDLINKLLKRDPTQRLGAANNMSPKLEGFKAGDNGPEKLRAHGFFKSIDFLSLSSDDPPALPYSVDVKEPAFDGASKAWMLQGDALDLGISSMVKAESEETNEFQQFLQPEEKLVLSGSVSKRSGIFAHTRFLLLVRGRNSAKLMYLDPVKMKLKGQIQLSPQVKVSSRANSKQFEVALPRRTFNFSDLLGDSERWIEAIGAEIARLKS